MTDQPTREELQTLRDRIAELEVARDQPVKVEVEGFEGLRQLSHAIETQQLDRFMETNSVPDGFWLFLGKMVAFTLVSFFVIAIVFNK